MTCPTARSLLYQPVNISLPACRDLQPNITTDLARPAPAIRIRCALHCPFGVNFFRWVLL